MSFIERGMPRGKRSVSWRSRNMRVGFLSLIGRSRASEARRSIRMHSDLQPSAQVQRSNSTPFPQSLSLSLSLSLSGIILQNCSRCNCAEAAGLTPTSASRLYRPESCHFTSWAARASVCRRRAGTQGVISRRGAC